MAYGVRVQDERLIHRSIPETQVLPATSRYRYKGNISRLGVAIKRAVRSKACSYRNCLGGGGFCESSGLFAPVSENISLIEPTAESMLDVSTGMKITFALLLLVMSRRLSM